MITLVRPVLFDPDVLDGVLRKPRIPAAVRTSPTFDPDAFDGVLRARLPVPVEVEVEVEVEADWPVSRMPELETVISAVHPLRTQTGGDPLRGMLDTPSRGPQHQETSRGPRPILAAVVQVVTPVPIPDVLRADEPDPPSLDDSQPVLLSGTKTGSRSAEGRVRAVSVAARPRSTVTRSMLGPAILSLGAGAVAGLMVLLMALTLVIVWSWTYLPPLPPPPPPRVAAAEPSLASVETAPPPPIAPITADMIVLPTSIGDSIVFPGTFAFDSVVPDGDYHSELARIVVRLAECPRVAVVGHTDLIGTPAVNEVIGRGRAQVVASELKKAGLPQERMEIRSQPGTQRRVVLSCEPRDELEPSAGPSAP